MGCIYSSYYACGPCPDGRCTGGIAYARTLEDCLNRENLIYGGCCVKDDNPTCTASCNACSSGTYYSTAPANSYVASTRKCTRTDCSTYTQNCYLCYTGCQDGGTYYASQPANVSSIRKYYYSNCNTVNRCYICSTGCHSGGTYYASTPSVSTSITSIKAYTNSNCTTSNSCYTCETGCGSCSAGTYSSTQPANTYIPAECEYTNTTCATEQRNCYYNCPEPSCAYLIDQLDEPWLDGGCSGQEDCVEVTMPVIIPVPENNYPPGYPDPMVGKEYNCSQEEVLTCHMPNINPDVVTIDAERINENDFIYQYQQDRFTGKKLNNPVRVTALYEDGDGSDDIIALYVWWTWDSDTDKSFLTPKNVYQQLDLKGQSTNERNYGLMIARSYTSNDWNNARVYIPDHSTSPAYWVNIGSVTDTLAIDNSKNSINPLDDDFVLITGIDINPISSQNRVELSLNMYFVNEDDFNPISAYVETRNYHLWGSVNDRIGYLPFNVPYYQNHSDVDEDYILDSGNDAWQDRGLEQAINNIDPTWHVDIIDPVAAIPDPVYDSFHEEVTVELNAKDAAPGDSGISYVRLDACKSGDDDPLPLTYDSTGNGLLDGTYTLLWCDDVENDQGWDIPNYNMTAGNSLLGQSGGTPGNPLNMSVFEKEPIIGLGGNKEGSITFYVTVMDMAGNTNMDDQATQIYLLEQWAIVEDALVFGSESAISMTRTLDDSTGTFGASTALSRLRNLEEYDFTNQALLGKFPELYEGLKSLINYSANHSFKATGYSGQLMDSASAYGELRDAYGNKSNNPDFEELSLGSGVSTIIGAGINGGSLRDLDNDGTPECTKEYCIWTWEAGDPTHKLVFDDGFECNGKGLIIANGNVDITPNFLTDSNADPENACIILANGNITIKTTDIGDQNPDDGYNNYDLVEAFLIANGYIEIEKVTTADPPNDRGLFVEGGLVGFTPEDQTNSSVLNRREIYYANMGQYPVLVVQGNSKYGILGRKLFGSQIDIYRSLQGFKPY